MELIRLKNMLDKAGIKYEYNHLTFEEAIGKPLDLGLYENSNAECLKYIQNQLVILNNDDKELVSCISQFGSYGCKYDLIELYDYKSDPIGFLKAEDAFEIIKLF